MELDSGSFTYEELFTDRGITRQYYLEALQLQIQQEISSRLGVSHSEFMLLSLKLGFFIIDPKKRNEFDRVVIEGTNEGSFDLFSEKFDPEEAVRFLGFTPVPSAITSRDYPIQSDSEFEGMLMDGANLYQVETGDMLKAIVDLGLIVGLANLKEDRIFCFVKKDRSAMCRVRMDVNNIA